MQTTSSQVLLLFCLVCVPICKCCSGDSDLIGKCGEEGDNCSTCYHTLVKSLMSSDSNVYKLSRAFFPTNSNDRPQFVTVTYQFKDMNSTLHHKVWYWSEKSSYFVYPLQTFEYLSLFFGKAAIFFSGNVSVTLDQECYFADHYMQHLTQRVSLICELYTHVMLYLIECDWLLRFNLLVIWLTGLCFQFCLYAPARACAINAEEGRYHVGGIV